MPSPSVSLRVGSLVGLMVGLVVLAGCTSPPASTFPVQGKVTVQKKPLTAGTVYFWPDTSKGNASKESAVGRIEPDGSYKLQTNGRNGAPPGWYKVTVDQVVMPGEAGATAVKPVPINAKYRKADTSGISIEVSENPKPAAYDIELK